MRLFAPSGVAPQEIQGVQISTAVGALPTPIAYGTPRWAGNLLWLNGFTATPIHSSTSGGKGAGKTAIGFTYSAYFIMGLGEGPLGQLQLINSFSGKPTSSEVVFNYTFLAQFNTEVNFIAPNANNPTGGVSTLTAQIAATASATFNILHNGTPVGTFNFAAGATVATFSVANAILWADSDTIEFVAPATPDATLAGLEWTILGAVDPALKYIDGTPYPFAYTYYTAQQIINGYDFFQGDYAQLPIAQITDDWPGQELAYRGIAYLYGGNSTIDSSATVQQIQVVLAAFLNATSPLNNSTITLIGQQAPYNPVVVALGCAEADPAACIHDLLTNAIYGAGFPPAFIGAGLFSTAAAANPAVGDAAYQTYCQAIGVAFSIALDSAESCSSILQRWADLTNSAWVWTGTLLEIIPYGDQPFSANTGYVAGNPLNIPLRYYVPNVTPLFLLTDDDFEQSKNEREDPVTVDRKDVAEKYNTVRLNFRDRTNQYSPNVAEAKDENAIDLYGIRVDNLADAKEFALMSYASIAAQLRVQRSVAIDRTFTFKLSWLWCFLEPMDIVALTEPNIGLNAQPVRIITIEEDEHYVLTVTAEIMLVGSATAVVYERQATEPSQAVYIGVPASAVHTPFIFEPTATMLAAQSAPNPTIVIGACGGVLDTADPNWGGAQVWVGIGAGASEYSAFGNIAGPSRMGLLTSTATTTSVISIDVNESGGTLETVGTAAATNNVTLCALTKANYSALELFSYETATLTGTGLYTLSNLARGLYGTGAQSWNPNDLFLRVDPNTFEVALPPQYVGQTLAVKLLSFNLAGQVTSTLASATEYDFTPTGSGFAQPTLLISGSVSGKPASGATVFTYVAAQELTLPSGLTTSQGYATVGATATATFTLEKNGSSIGTMIFASGGSGSPQVATFSFSTAVVFNAADALTIIAPSPQDSTLANVSWTLVANLP